MKRYTDRIVRAIELATYWLEDNEIRSFRDLAEWLRCYLHLCDDCSRCQTFICWMCMKRVSWSFGCADDMPDICDSCWSEAHRPRRLSA